MAFGKYRSVLFISFLSIIISCKKFSGKIMDKPQFSSNDLEMVMDTVFQKNQLMGMSIILMAHGEIVWQGSYGLADKSRNIPITKSTVYRVASISKSVTATALLQLWEAGKVDLDRDVSEYLGWKLEHPEYKQVPITLRHLLSHQSSIRDGKGYGGFSRHMLSKKLDIRELLSLKGSYYTDDLFADHRPGDYFSYTNCTWGIIASVIEKVSGLRFDEYCREYIFGPLGMTSDFNAASLSNIDSLAVLYRYVDNQWKPQADDYGGILPEPRTFEEYRLGQNGLLFGPQGSLRSSARDLAVFSLMFMNDGLYNGHRILEKKTIDKMLTSHWAYNGSNGDTWENFFLSYGLGAHQITNTKNADILFPDRKMVGHPGIAYGLLSDMYFDKDTQSGIIFITNGSKEAYEYGMETSFYQVEEDVFKKIYPFLRLLEKQSLKKQD